MQGFFQRYLLLYRPLTSKLNDLLKEYDLSYSLWQIIFYVKKKGPSTLVTISNYYHIEKPSITRSVHRLEKKELMEQIPGKNRREKIIQLTSKGEVVYQSCRERITRLENQVLKDIPEEELLAAFHFIPQIRDNLLQERGKNR
ncbi:MarR family winged helix-turn-helix transcriptional regulator [Virgibacillus alimentarius]|uniref:DNA-binding MarR family transcriptional regulator n=1 Tax=Virgibacillus alimentarius TaxID=698769 RepID=A0ABS4SAG6_9BACI|nr:MULTISPECIES: winged helix DNA-binding protein [Virgibacillus]MBP2258506.1 DNA-binding MarR family transcriptional regulator [Virgibacillus alimentarius]HLR69251.1 winged helix DNA-binding protein [Virgibacillus sp.]